MHVDCRTAKRAMFSLPLENQEFQWVWPQRIADRLLH